HAMTGVGAIATQARRNTDLGVVGLKLLELGLSPKSAIEGLLAEDAAPQLRQVAGIDRHGRTFSFTGSECTGWAGSVEGAHSVSLGNLLVGREPLERMAERFEALTGCWLGVRLLVALAAGVAAGGDRRGHRSAALLVTPMVSAPGGRAQPDALLYRTSLRVDDHAEPLAELNRLFQLLLDDREHLGAPMPGTEGWRSLSTASVSGEEDD
ncbi:MAG: DUF1028 domain-containing protein, partial [Dehalococcoidia bacterium]